MSEHKGTVVAKSQYGIKFSEDGPWFNWAKGDKKGSPFHDVSKGDSVRIEYNSWDKDGGSKGYTVYVIENLSRPSAASTDDPFPPEDDFPPKSGSFVPDSGTLPAAPESPESDSEQQDGQYRSPKDFRRTSALAQAVAFYAGVPDAEVDSGRVVETAKRFERYLGTGE